MLLSADYVSVTCFQVLYDLVGSAKLNAVDPEAYLLQAPIRIADHPINRIEELLPWDLAVILPEHATKK
jgi:transposase